MAKTAPKGVRFDPEIFSSANKWLAANKASGIDFSDLVNKAVRAFISQPQSIELKPITFAEGESMAKEAITDFKAEIDQLK
jgi:hypothetical protein